MHLIDTHSHIDVHHFAHDFKDVLEAAREAGIIAQILPGVCRQWWPNLLGLCEQESDLFAAIGLHPMYLRMHVASDIEELEKEADNGNLVALGEVGLDYFVRDCDHEQQQRLFENQLSIANNHSLPLLLHIRKAHDRVLSTLRKSHFPHGGIVHAFSGSMQQAEQFIGLGFKISFGGTITYERARKIRKIAATLPLESIVLETDAPDIPPAAHHGERNLPEYLPLIVAALSHLREESIDELCRATTRNVLDLLQLDLPKEREP